MADVLGIHGVGNLQVGLQPERAAAAIARRWADSMSVHGLPATEHVEVAYYSHLLITEHFHGSADILLESPEVTRLLAPWVAAMGYREEVTSGRATQPVRQMCSWLAVKYRLDHALVRRFVAIYLKEVHEYFHNERCVHQRISARDLVGAAIRRCAPRVVIAHSLGSAIGYEALWSNPDLHVDTLITLGSPLGMPHVVFDRLEPPPQDGKGAKPPNVATWLNVADVGDLVAIPTHLSKHFKGLSVDIETSIGMFDFHRVSSYLRSPLVGEVLTNGLTGRWQ
ncbi:GPI inositol-deacylase [Embleya sp. NBC_00888]|uniref:hypothetical protein n=1 Tax=Embleya sp. NBC_00888 TaxID=2975960 RepID=UPI0038660025|nr:GPI inositol-deacylase [Embleya sp. NBC_00888]